MSPSIGELKAAVDRITPGRFDDINRAVYLAGLPAGLGTKFKNMIHAGLDLVPMPAGTRAKIKQCGGCAKRAAKLDQMFPGKG